MNNKGFTLLEMIVVIMIIAALILLTIPNVSKVIESVDNKACSAQCKLVDAAIVQFKLDEGRMPYDIYELIGSGYINQEQMTCPNGKNISIVSGHAET